MLLEELFKTCTSNNMETKIQDFRPEVEQAYEVLKDILTSPVNLYTKDPDLYDRVHAIVETIEYALYNNNKQQ